MTSLFMNRYEDLPPGLQDLAKKLERREGDGRRDSDTPANGPRPQLTMRTLTSLIAVGGMLFAAGENWHRIDEQSDKLSTHIQQDDHEHARLEVEKADREAMEEHFNSLQRQIEDLKQTFLRQGRR